MIHLPFDTANNWADFPHLRRALFWRVVEGADPHILFEARIDHRLWAIRLNDFPDEPLHTLIVAGEEVIHFDDWPAFWGACPPDPETGAKTA